MDKEITTTLEASFFNSDSYLINEFVDEILKLREMLDTGEGEIDNLLQEIVKECAIPNGTKVKISLEAGAADCSFNNELTIGQMYTLLATVIETFAEEKPSGEIWITTSVHTVRNGRPETRGISTLAGEVNKRIKVVE